MEVWSAPLSEWRVPLGLLRHSKRSAKAEDRHGRGGWIYMPKLYEYLGIIVSFYSNEHDPIHVHGRYQDRESKAEIVVCDGKVVEVKIVKTRSKPLAGPQLKSFKALVECYADEIVQSWVDLFVLNKSIKMKKISQRLK